MASLGHNELNFNLREDVYLQCPRNMSVFQTCLTFVWRLPYNFTMDYIASSDNCLTFRYRISHTLVPHLDLTGQLWGVYWESKVTLLIITLCFLIPDPCVPSTKLLRYSGLCSAHVTDWRSALPEEKQPGVPLQQNLLGHCSNCEQMSLFFPKMPISRLIKNGCHVVLWIMVNHNKPLILLSVCFAPNYIESFSEIKFGTWWTYLWMFRWLSTKL